MRIFADRDVVLQDDTALSKCSSIELNYDPYTSGVNEGITYSISDADGDVVCLACPLATFSDVNSGRAIAIIGSHGWIEIAVNGGSAAAQLQLSYKDTVRVKLR